LHEDLYTCRNNFTVFTACPIIRDQIAIPVPSYIFVITDATS
jgi:hypothetical protein